uniref:UBA domain-containing protein n=1 Tax=Percolomonas cosmopolitus TaxID=63605 RepID=A0A7S1PFP7_9EUKA|mmetsp:Transcript_11676/g.43905  ORF Transcript_11676/g.43905 Transcript_11676/m.43905 type:complete len:389 (+) Transcript_11676:811-1977(+)|eukprot:CAMPEP_0117445404 /NCGR_PEP_ID=MMETSP0759-20121206/5776_1 /TAXON_ID=63605 /ORGANISM="Percolomonas cosmopolitus, Strain WS" /LENGTH=388 /DNA_ID=CAMNT_0005237575 /DNA_START=648 /DNA_END=1814 /DNA_ORIENTATION=+
MSSVHFKFIRPTLTKRFSLSSFQQDFQSLLSKLKALSNANFNFLEVQDVDGDWIRVDTSDEWEYMRSLLQEHQSTVINVRDGLEWQQHDEQKAKASEAKSSASNSGNTSTTSNSGASTSSSGSASGINAQDIMASVLPSLMGVVKNNPQLLSTVVSTVGTLGTQGSQLLQSNIIPSLVGMASYSGGSSSSQQNQPQNNNSSSSNNSSNNATPEAVLSSLLSQLFVGATQATSSSSSTTNSTRTNSNNTSSSSSGNGSSHNQTPKISEIFTPEHIQQGLLMGESFMRNFSDTYLKQASQQQSQSSENNGDTPSAPSSTESKLDSKDIAAPSAPPTYGDSPVPEVEVDETNVALLVSMGFLDRDQNRRALKKWHNNVNRAVQQLLNDPYF